MTPVPLLYLASRSPRRTELLRQLADNLQQWRVAAADVAFVVGSADGLDAGFRRGAAARLALSPMTLPHGLVRVVLAEQLYRAASLNAGHPYHRE